MIARLSLRLLPLLLLGAACGQAAPPPPFDGEAALALVAAQVAFGPRVPGTTAHRLAGDWMDSLLTAQADTVLVQAWQHETATGDTIPLRNFLARFRPEARHRVLLLAHWDTRPRSDGPGRAEGADSMAPIPGANDGGSGTAVLLEAQHTCVQMRGVREPEARTRTTAYRGTYADDPAIRTEFLTLIRPDADGAT